MLYIDKNDSEDICYNNLYFKQMMFFWTKES